MIRARITSAVRARLLRWRLFDALTAGSALLLLLTGLFQLNMADRGLVRQDITLPEAPLTRYRLAASEQAPVVVIAHGFSGSRQMMQPFALTLARNGYIVLSLDFPGHGANPRPLLGEIGAPRRAEILLEALTAVIDYATALPQYDGRLALLGHSMAGDIAVRYVLGEGDADALVAVSPYLSQDLGAYPPETAPENLLFIYGEWEPEMIREQGRAAVAAVANGITAQQVRPEVTYGEHADGSARRLVIAAGVEHIGVLYSQQSLQAALDWLNQVFDHQGSGWIDTRSRWLGVYFLGVILLAWPLARLLPRVSNTPLGAGLGWRRLLPATLGPALLTPLILRPLPSDFLPIAIADYLALHFALYGLLSAGALWLLGARPGSARARVSRSGFALALLAVIGYQALTIMLPTDLYVAALLPDPHRVTILFVLFTATALWLSVDEWLTRGPGAQRGAYTLTKALFLVSLALAVVLDLEQLFFLVIIIPAILILFILFGLFSGWVYRRTGHPLIAALANALLLAVAITASFPIAD